MAVLGIDFGTSFSTMCFLNQDGKPETIHDENGLDKIPSIVYWGADGIKVGQAASDILQDASELPEEQRRKVLARMIKSVKRDFFPDRSIVLPDASVISPLDVVAEILKYLKRNAEELCFHQTVSGVTLTHPVAFTEAQKKLLIQAAKKAGFQSVELLPEPIAAALGYAASGAKLGNGILVYDLGGGTFDLAYLQRDENGEFRFPVKPLGDARCGGDDFDQMIYDYAEKVLEEKYHCKFSEDFDALNLSFLSVCCKAKEKLSRNSEAVLRYFLEKQGTSFSLSIDRNTFYQMIGDRLNNSIRLTGKMLNLLSQKDLKVDTVLLIGGSTRIPLVADELAKILPVAPLKTMTCDDAVAKGSVCSENIQKVDKFFLSVDSVNELEKNISFIINKAGLAFKPKKVFLPFRYSFRDFNIYHRKIMADQCVDSCQTSIKEQIAAPLQSLYESFAIPSHISSIFYEIICNSIKNSFPNIKKMRNKPPLGYAGVRVLLFLFLLIFLVSNFFNFAICISKGEEYLTAFLILMASLAWLPLYFIANYSRGLFFIPNAKMAKQIDKDGYTLLQELNERLSSSVSRELLPEQQSNPHEENDQSER